MTKGTALPSTAPQPPIDDGGPAFPKTVDGTRKQQDGMSLRDYYAGLAMQQMCAGPGARMVADKDDFYDPAKGNWKEIVASNAFSFADAMIAERAKRNKQ